MAQPELLVTMAHPDFLEYPEKWVLEDSLEIEASQVEIRIEFSNMNFYILKISDWIQYF